MVVTIQDAQSEDEAGIQPKTKKAKVRCSPNKSCVIKDNAFPSPV